MAAGEEKGPVEVELSNTLQSSEALVFDGPNGEKYAIPLGLLDQFKVPAELADQFEDVEGPSGEQDREESVVGHFWWNWQPPRVQQPPVQTWNLFRGGNVCATGGGNFWGR